MSCETRLKATQSPQHGPSPSLVSPAVWLLPRPAPLPLRPLSPPAARQPPTRMLPTSTTDWLPSGLIRNEPIWMVFLGST